MEVEFCVGDYVDTKTNGYGRIVDILKSETSNRIAVCVEFTYNFPNPRGFDTMIFEPEKPYGMDKWVVVDKKFFDDELKKKAISLIDVVLEKTGGYIHKNKDE